jgi:DNA invertase Pin-like site-specific DNA recombinase
MRAMAANALTNRVKPVVIRCAIYTRKSTEEGLEQDFNTLDAQREAAESFIRSQKNEGWVAVEKLYDDGGFTGANMDRPALKLLLADIAMGEVNCVVVCVLSAKLRRPPKSRFSFRQQATDGCSADLQPAGDFRFADSLPV